MKIELSVEEFEQIFGARKIHLEEPELKVSPIRVDDKVIDKFDPNKIATYKKVANPPNWDLGCFGD